MQTQPTANLRGAVALPLQRLDCLAPRLARLANLRPGQNRLDGYPEVCRRDVANPTHFRRQQFYRRDIRFFVHAGSFPRILIFRKVHFASRVGLGPTAHFLCGSRLVVFEHGEIHN